MKASEAITSTEGYLSLTDVYGNPQLVEEVSMARYEQFFRLWHVGMAAGLKANPSGTFTYNWVWCREFREAFEKALLIFGLRAEDLTPSQIRALVLGDEQGKPGLLFQLHNDIPGEVSESEGKKPPEGESQPQKPKGSEWLKRLRSAVSTRLATISKRVGLAWQALTGSLSEKSSG